MYSTGVPVTKPCPATLNTSLNKSTLTNELKATVLFGINELLGLFSVNLEISPPGAGLSNSYNPSSVPICVGVDRACWSPDPSVVRSTIEVSLRLALPDPVVKNGTRSDAMLLIAPFRVQNNVTVVAETALT